MAQRDNYECEGENCEGEVIFPMRYCPTCREELVWGQEEVGTDLEEKDSGWATSSRFSYSPWDGESDGYADEQPVKTAKGFNLLIECAYCDGRFERFMSYCPSCGTGESEAWFGSAEAHIWNREFIGHAVKLVGKRLDENCPHCQWALHSAWRFCPWCGEKSDLFPGNIREEYDKLSQLDAIDQDESDKLLRRIKLGKEEDDYSVAVVRLRKITERELHNLCEANKLDTRNLKTVSELKDHIQKNRKGVLSGATLRRIQMVADIGNEGAHWSGKNVSADVLTQGLQNLHLWLKDIE